MYRSAYAGHKSRIGLVLLGEGTVEPVPGSHLYQEIVSEATLYSNTTSARPWLTGTRGLVMSQRMTTDAWRQDAVLTNTDVEWLTGAAPTMIRHLLKTYHERFGIILPTAGAILDMGRTLTHKKLVVELALQGLTTKEIARRIYHTEEAVDAYLKSFDKLLLLRHHGLLVTGMLRLLECSRSSPS